MGMAICMVELTSIARGIETSDDMIKAAQVTLLRGTTVCPGKYMVIVGGETGAVRAALEAGHWQKEGEFIVVLFLFQMYMSNCSLQLRTQEVVDPQAIGVVEFYSIASAIKAADAAAKAAQVTLIEVRTGYAVGGKGYFTLTGDVGAVRAAVAAAEKQSELYIGSIRDSTSFQTGT